MRVLLIDNNDSFTYNIVSTLKRIEQVDTTVLNSDTFDITLLEKFEKIILSPGPGMPKDFPILDKVISYCLKNNKPLLGICLGHQAICCYFNAKLFNLNQVIHGHRKKIKINNSSSIYKHIPPEIEVGLYHSWAVEMNSLGEDLQITGVSEDGVLMSVQHSIKPIFGVQYHPESFLTQYGKQILENFLLI